MARLGRQLYGSPGCTERQLQMFGTGCILHERTHEFASHGENRRACGQLWIQDWRSKAKDCVCFHSKMMSRVRVISHPLHTGSVRDDLLSTIGDRRSTFYIVIVAPTHETFRRTVPNMALGAGPSISLAVSSTTKKNPTTSFGSAALSLAAEFDRELVRFKSDADKAKICRTFRDTIMRVSMWADDIAAAFTNAFAPFLHKPQRGQDTEAWKSFASLAQRSQQTRAHDAQGIRHQTAIVAVWGADISEHYGWHELSLDNTRLLRSFMQACAVAKAWPSSRCENT